MVKVFEEISLFEGYILMSFHQLHGCSLPCFDVSHQVDWAEVTTPHLLQLLVFQHCHLLYANHFIYTAAKVSRFSSITGALSWLCCVLCAFLPFLYNGMMIILVWDQVIFSYMSAAKKTAFSIFDIFCMELVSSLKNSICMYSRNLFSLSSATRRPCSVRHRPAVGPLNSTSPTSLPQEHTNVL